MGNNLTEKGAKAAEIRAQKRAAALRDNLKRRKIVASNGTAISAQQGEPRDETTQNRE